MHTTFQNNHHVDCGQYKAEAETCQWGNGYLQPVKPDYTPSGRGVRTE